MVLLTAAMEGYFITSCAIWERVLLLGAAVALRSSIGVEAALRFGVAALVILIQLRKTRRPVAEQYQVSAYNRKQSRSLDVRIVDCTL